MPTDDIVTIDTKFLLDMIRSLRAENDALRTYLAREQRAHLETLDAIERLSSELKNAIR